MGKATTTKEGYLGTRGAWRFATHRGKAYVVGHGRAIACSSELAAHQMLNEMLGATRAKKLAAKAAAVAATPAVLAADYQGTPLAVGDTVMALDNPDILGVVEEIGTRSLSFTEPCGTTWRRAPRDVAKIAAPIIVKSCGCGLTYTRAAWERLPFIGNIDVPEDSFGPRTITELRNCTCGSTIGVDTEIT